MMWFHERQTEGQTGTWMTILQRLFYTERWRGNSVCEGTCVSHLSDYVWMHAVSITECPSTQYKNNCESVWANVQMCVCVCVSDYVVRAGGHRQIKWRQKDEHPAGLGRTERWPQWTNRGVPQGRWRRGVTKWRTGCDRWRERWQQRRTRGGKVQRLTDVVELFSSVSFPDARLG